MYDSSDTYDFKAALSNVTKQRTHWDTLSMKTRKAGVRRLPHRLPRRYSDTRRSSGPSA